MWPRESINIRIPMLLVALLASLSVHLPIYEVLGVLRDYFREQATKAAKDVGGVEIEFEAVEPALAAQSRPAPQQEPKPQAPAKELAKLESAPEQAKTQPVKESLQRQSIEQRSDDPSVQTPRDARFVAEENRRVEEETVAKIRNYLRDDAQAALSKARAAADQEVGDSEEQKSEDLAERKGSEARTATPQEAKKTPTNQETASKMSQPEESTPAEGAEVPTDPNGTVAVEPGTPGERSMRRKPSLRVGWKAFESTFGKDQLAAEYEAFAAQRRSKARGGNRQKEWKEFRSAIENFVPNVKPGNQTALNAAASPFASYLAALHRRIHREFADRFLANLPTGEPLFNDYNLRTKLEVILNQDGSVFRVGVVETSGFMPYDYGAFAAVMRGQPYPPAPGSILSGDGRVYLHWAFYRNERQCGTFNAEPYILPNPPGMRAPAPGPLQDKLEWGGVIPKSAAPAGDGSGVAPGQDPPSDVKPVPPSGRPARDNDSKTPAPKTPSAPRMYNGSAVG